MGAVYLAFLEPLDKPVAIKEMYLTDTGEAAIQQFTKEATLLAHLKHPGLVPVTDFFNEGDRHYFSMAYIEGTTLAEVINEKGRLGLEDAVRWTLELCSVLEFLHTQNPPILFRDLKPTNVMIDHEGKVRLIDFGIARVLEQDERTATFLQGVGSAGYSPLEQYGNDMTTDQRSDLYSLGATLYAMLTGKAPVSPISRISERTPVESPRRLNPEVPIALEAVMVQMLAVRKEERQRSIAVAREEIETAVSRVLNLAPSGPPVPRAGSVGLDDPTSRLLNGPTSCMLGPGGAPEALDPATTEVQLPSLVGGPAKTNLMEASEEAPTGSFKVGQAALWGVLLLLVLPYFSDPYGRFFLFEVIATPFHKLGHMLGSPFGRFPAMLGGPLGQMALPLGVTIAVLKHRPNVFNLAACGVWLSQTLVSWGAHMHKARMAQPVFFGETDHDWQFLLGKMRLLHECEKHGVLAMKIGQLGMLVGLAVMMAWLGRDFLLGKKPTE